MGAVLPRELVPGRSCGSCNVCCVHLTINDPQLKKLQGYRCRNLTPQNSCAIYDCRPQTCRDFFCGWRYLKWVREPLRPDRSHVLIRLFVDKKDGGTAVGISLMILDPRAFKADGLAETVAAAVNAGVPVQLNVPGPPGHTSSGARINEVLLDAVTFKDKASLLAALKRAYAQGRKGNFEPIVLGPPAAGTEDASADDLA